MHHDLQKLIGLRSSVGASKEEVERLQKEKTELKRKRRESFQGDKAAARRNSFSIREFEEGEARI